MTIMLRTLHVLAEELMKAYICYIEVLQSYKFMDCYTLDVALPNQRLGVQFPPVGCSLGQVAQLLGAPRKREW